MTSASPGSIEARAERRVGQTLSGKYTLKRVLGVGGMAAVYLAVHRNKNRVAVKLLHAELSTDEDIRGRFVREGYVANSIRHRGVVRVLDDDMSEDGAAYLVMELLEGETLFSRCERLAGPLTEREAVALVHELCDVLSAAHEQQIVHRDIKPENVFLTTDGALKVLDFGIARMHEGLPGGATMTGRVFGTPAFMPPEQARGRRWEVDARADVWAAGATLFTLISGKHVHEAETLEEHMIAAAMQPARSLAAVAPAVHAAIVAVVDRALAFAKEDRFGTAAEMRDALAAAAKQAFGALPPLPHGVAEGTAGGPLVSSRRATASAETVDAGASDPSAPSKASARADLPPATLPKPAEVSPSGGDKAAAPAAGARAVPTSWALAGAGLLGLAALYAYTRKAPPVVAPASSAVASSASASSSASVPPARCAVNKDCGATGGVCGRAGICIEKRGCASAKECVDKAGGKPSICIKEEGTCAPLETPECRWLLMEPGDLENDATLWVGAMIAQSGPIGSEIGKLTMQTLDLARHDFASVSNGVPGARATDPARPIGVVLCDDSDDGKPAVQHLVGDLRVPAVIGFTRSKDVTDFAAEHWNGKGVLALAALNQSPALTSIPRSPEGPRLVYRFAANANGGASVIAALIGEVLAKRFVHAPGQPLRVAILRLDNNTMLGYADTIVSRLRVQEKSVSEGGAEVRQLAVADENPKATLERAREQLLAFAPQVIVDLAEVGALDDDFLPRLEREWPATKPRPIHVGGSGAGNLTTPAALKLVAARPDARARMFSVDTPSSLAPNVKLAIRYSETYADKLTPAETVGAVYDAFYALAYAVAALGDKPVTGVNLARALARLKPPGEPIEVGPAAIPSGLKLLRDGRSLDLAGTTTTLDFDLDTGDAPTDYVVLCPKRGAKPGTWDAAESGLSLDARSGKLVGSLRCF